MIWLVAFRLAKEKFQKVNFNLKLYDIVLYLINRD